MYKVFFTLVAIIHVSCTHQAEAPQATPAQKSEMLSISPSVDSSLVENREVIAVLRQFLKTKNESARENPFWVAADFDKYIYPYFDIFNIEKGKHGDQFFRPSLMELVELPNEEKLIKLGFVGITPESNESIIRCIYNLIAVETGDSWKFKRAMNYNTRDWHTVQSESITYYLPKGKIANTDEMTAQADDIKKLCAFFETDAIPIDYYSCNTPKQIFEIRGFDYFPNMYFGNRGGQAAYADIIYSGNNSEIYTHEIAHIYMKHLFPRSNRLLDEGMATLLGGSVGFDYKWHKAKMAEYVQENDINFLDYLDPYQKSYIDNETPIPYMVGALICERTLRLHGKAKLFELFASEGDLWQIIELIGLTEENFNQLLKAELKQAAITLKLEKSLTS